MSLQPRPPLLLVENVDGATVVKVATADLGEPHIQAIREELFGLAAGLARPRLMLDLGEVRFLTSTALGAFVALHKRVTGTGGRLVLANVGDAVYEVFDVSRLTQVLDVRRREPSGPGPRLAPLAS